MDQLTLSAVKHLVITGASGGLGKAIVEEFAAASWQIDAPTHGELDVTHPAAIQDYFNSRSVDLLICAAGTIRDAPLSRLDEATWDEVLAVNYHGAAACAAAALPQMIEKQSGHVIFISSHSAIRPPRGQAAYATAKSALLGLTASLAQRNGRHGVRVNAILPGFLETAMTESVAERRRAEILGDHVLGRFNTPVTVARFIRHLQEELTHTSGQVFQLDSRIS